MWKILGHSEIDKSFEVDGPLPLEIDYDDVNHDEVDFLINEVVQILNTYWNRSGAPERLKEFSKIQQAKWEAEEDD